MRLRVRVMLDMFRHVSTRCRTAHFFSLRYLIIEIVTWQLSIFVFRNLVFFLEIRDLLAIYIYVKVHIFLFFHNIIFLKNWKYASYYIRVVYTSFRYISIFPNYCAFLFAHPSFDNRNYDVIIDNRSVRKPCFFWGAFVCCCVKCEYIFLFIAIYYLLFV